MISTPGFQGPTLFLIDGPYVSEFLKQSIYNGSIPVIDTDQARSFLDAGQCLLVPEAQAIAALKSDVPPKLYTNSENALAWIFDHQCPEHLLEPLNLAKDKLKFRARIQDLHEGYFFMSADADQLHSLPTDTIPFPVILKPAVGFFSLGVQRIKDLDHWEQVLQSLASDVESYHHLYPLEVLNPRQFILEGVIPGNEYAVDCYFDSQGRVVILNILEHLFASESHMNDRIYFTSSSVIRENMLVVETYLNQLGQRFQFSDFPAHIELRIHNGIAHAIEINPLRFGGWCSTADLAFHAWGMNLYTCFLESNRPDWGVLTEQQQDVYALIVLDNSTGVEGKSIRSFDYDRLMDSLSDPLELRKTDYRKYPIFGFVMCRVAADKLNELNHLLYSDLTEFVTTQDTSSPPM